MPEVDDPAVRAWALLFELLEAQRPRMLETCAEFGMTPVELKMMIELARHRTCGMQDLSPFHDKSTVTRVISRLVDRGLVARRENPANRREKLVDLTEEGQAVGRALMERVTTPPKSIRELSLRDKEHLAEALQHAVESARRDG